MKIKKHVFIKIISFLCAAVVVACGFAVKNYCNQNYLKEQMANGYKQSLYEFSSLINEINFGLKKQMYSSSEKMLSNLSADIYKNSAAAKECLERLPISPQNTENIYKFLATAGDFSKAMAAVNTPKITENNREQLKKLVNFSEKLTDKINATASTMQKTNSLYLDVDNVMNKLENATDFSASAEDIGEIADGIPTMIYDGPFSDHVTSKQAALLKNQKNISKNEALIYAQKYLGEKNIKYVYDEKSTTESFVFEGSNSVCAVTKRGGFCLYMNKNVSKISKRINNDTAIKNAKKYLKDIYNCDFAESYYIINDNIITVNLAFTEDNVIYYPDLIKVGVRLDNGNIVSTECRGFVMNHHQRQKEKFMHSKEQAERKINNELDIISSNKVLILDNALNEKYCYEFKCKAQNDEDVLVYINDKTLEEENVFIIIHAENGTLTK